MKLEIKGKEIELRYGFRALMIYEKITNQTFAPTGLTDILIFMYSVILGSDRNITLSFDDFLDEVDQQPEVVSEFSVWLTENIQKNTKMKGDVSVEKTDSDSKKNY